VETPLQGGAKWPFYSMVLQQSIGVPLIVLASMPAK
jgi:hypothetical protein